MIPYDELVMGNQVQRPGCAEGVAGVVSPPRDAETSELRPRLPKLTGTPSEMVVKLFELYLPDGLPGYLAQFEEDEHATHTGVGA